MIVVKGFLLLQKIFTHGSEGVDKYTCLQTDASVLQIGSNVIAIASSEDFLFLANSHFKAATGNIGGLGMGVMMERTDGSFIAFHFYGHQVLIVTHDLTNNTITDIVPLLVYSFIPVLPPLMILWLPRGKTRNITGYIPAVFLIFLTEALP